MNEPERDAFFEKEAQRAAINGNWGTLEQLTRIQEMRARKEMWSWVNRFAFIVALWLVGSMLVDALFAVYGWVS